jgi:NACalpha-BTF3-like transcription factor
MTDEDHETSASQNQSTKQHSSGAADLEKVTDYAEEKELSGNLNNAINVIADKRKKDAEQKAELERKLASVKLKKEDVDLVCAEFEISKLRAERLLKENNGDLATTLTALINAQD